MMIVMMSPRQKDWKSFPLTVFVRVWRDKRRVYFTWFEYIIFCLFLHKKKVKHHWACGWFLGQPAHCRATLIPEILADTLQLFSSCLITNDCLCCWALRVGLNRNECRKSLVAINAPKSETRKSLSSLVFLGPIHPWLKENVNTCSWDICIININSRKFTSTHFSSWHKELPESQCPRVSGLLIAMHTHVSVEGGRTNCHHL